MLAELLRESAQRLKQQDSNAYPLGDAILTWQQFVSLRFPHVTSKPMGKRHERLWNWFDALEPGIKPRPRVEVWPRGGAKSSSGELGCVWSGTKLTRRFVLYVSETQDQADKHVQAVGTLFDRMGVGRATNRYGNSKGWRRDQLRTANGFNVASLGLDTAARGIRLDEFRPDLIIFDDIDGRFDTRETIKKKIGCITDTLLPAGSSDCAVLFLQNLIHAAGIITQLVDGSADFLHNREVPCVEPAIYGLVTVREKQPDGTYRYRIIAGTPSWAGQDITTCEKQINEWGLSAFLREAQHEVHEGGGVFKSAWFDDRYSVLPRLLEVYDTWDTAIKEQQQNDETACVVWGAGENGRLHVLRVVHGRWETPDVSNFLVKQADWLRNTYGDRYRGSFVEDKVSGTTMMQYLRRQHANVTVTGIRTGREGKEERAHGITPMCESGRVLLPDVHHFPTTAAGVAALLKQLTLFPTGQNDDLVDAFVYGVKRYMGTLQLVRSGSGSKQGRAKAANVEN